MSEQGNFDIPGFLPNEFNNDKEVRKWREEEKEFAKFMHNCIKVVAIPFNANKSSHKNLKVFELHKLIKTPF